MTLHGVSFFILVQYAWAACRRLSTEESQSPGTILPIDQSCAANAKATPFLVAPFGTAAFFTLAIADGTFFANPGSDRFGKVMSNDPLVDILTLFHGSVHLR
jgi:hypothetical protein